MIHQRTLYLVETLVDIDNTACNVLTFQLGLVILLSFLVLWDVARPLVSHLVFLCRGPFHSYWDAIILLFNLQFT